MINIPGINSVIRTTSPAANLGIVPRALGVFIDPYHPQGFKGTISGTDITDAKYPCLAPGVSLTLKPTQKIGSASATDYTSPTKYYADGGAAIQAVSPYYYQGFASGVGDYIKHFSIWLKPSSTITKSSALQVPVQLEYNVNVDGVWYVGLGSVTGLLTDEYIAIVDTGYENEVSGSPRTNRRTGVKTGGALTGNTWVNISFNWDQSAGHYRIYVNNVECSDYLSSSAPNYGGHVKLLYANNYSLTLGALTGDVDGSNNSLGGREFFTGRISAYTQYYDSLTSQEMTENFNYFKSRFGL